ncbi:Mpp10 protein family protein [Cryptosporidium meleagridis]|uniref:Mpp10 protein family protein n=1 Tax=Cryptosporidium meleagridis TaxID=93969 RepID=A0A2P4Z024_9CRYT|nr:Mpp10 protein family protein [Cryptosporidium meleagridis]
MEEIDLFLKFFENRQVNLQQISHESSKMKKITFSIFKIVIADLDKKTLIDGLINKFEIDNSSLWNSFELILKPELKKLKSNIENIVKSVDFELYNSNSNTYLNKTFKKSLLISDKKNITKKKSKKFIDQTNSSEQTLTNNKPSTQDVENIDFFDYDEMVKFVDEGVQNPNFEYSESETSEFSDPGGVDDASNLKYDDFFLDTKGTGESVIEKSLKDYEIDDFSLSESESVLNKNKLSENLINNTQFPNMKLDHMSKLSRDKNKMDIIIDEFEESIIKEKEWYKLGETSITNREKNSLLNIHLEVPQFSSTNNSIKYIDGLSNEIISNDEFNAKDINSYLESIVKQRILNDLFDDVKPKIELLKEFDRENKNEGTEIQTEKSKLSLAEIYSKKYEEQIIGNKNDEYSDEKKQLSGLFTEIMCKLDNLSNQYYATNLPILRDSISNENTPALKTEDSIPVIISNNTRLAPQEIKPQGKLLKRSEMTRLEKKSDRNSTKRKIKRRKESGSDSKIGAKLSGKITGKSLNKRGKSVIKPHEHESFNKRFKSHHFIS